MSWRWVNYEGIVNKNQYEIGLCKVYGIVFIQWCLEGDHSMVVLFMCSVVLEKPELYCGCWGLVYSQEGDGFSLYSMDVIIFFIGGQVFYGP